MLRVLLQKKQQQKNKFLTLMTDQGKMIYLTRSAFKYRYALKGNPLKGEKNNLQGILIHKDSESVNTWHIKLVLAPIKGISITGSRRNEMT